MSSLIKAHSINYDINGESEDSESAAEGYEHNLLKKSNTMFSPKR
jgi:hypothetical protein